MDFSKWKSLVDNDRYLEPYQDKLEARQNRLKQALDEINQAVGSLDEMSCGYEYFGFNRGEKTGKPGVWYREWAPEAEELRLMGEFNDWNREEEKLSRDEYGVWSIFLGDSKYKKRLTHKSLVKVVVKAKGETKDRIPAYIKRVEFDEKNRIKGGVYWNPEPYKWRHSPPPTPKSLRIYETHIGMAQEKHGVGSFVEFKQEVLPRINRLGYNYIQLMAVAEHPYYASFGYQVSNFYAVSSRFGTPEELMELIDEAHGMGILVLMDIVHSHSVKNVDEGLNNFDGSNHQYFHQGSRGEHPAWDTKLFDYDKFEVKRFLLSNVKYFLKEIGFDGFRFDGVTSMIYNHHGLGVDFDHYDKYFENVDEDALIYLKLANLVCQQNKAITIAEEVSGMPGMAWPVEQGGVGFDYRLAMGLPDYWIALLKHERDEEWGMKKMYETLVNRRRGEKHIGYVESHDQALVGDKTVAFWLMDQEMYWKMHQKETSLIIERGMALHKMIRLITFFLGGEGWLNFMGNEFAHPEWIDFPRDGNDNSYAFARRQWSLVDNEELRYKHLNEFDVELNNLDKEFGLLSETEIECLEVDEKHKLLVVARGNAVGVFNFHTDWSRPDLQIPVPKREDYQVRLSTDENSTGGAGRIRMKQVYPIEPWPWKSKLQSLKIYAPARTAQILVPQGNSLPASETTSI